MSRPPRAARPVLLALAVAIAAPASLLAREPAAPAVAGPATSVLPRHGAAQVVAPRGLVVTWRAQASAARRSAVRSAAGVVRLSGLGDGRRELVRPAGRSLEAAAAALRARPDVERVVLDRHRSASIDPTGEPGWSSQWGHHNTGQPINGYWGVNDVDVDGLEALKLVPNTAPIVVAVIDDGVDFSHPDLAAAAWTNPGESGLVEGVDRRTNGIDDDGNGFVDDVHGWDFCNDDNTVHDPGFDDHGTAVASVVAAANNRSGVVGIAPGVKVMALKFMQNESGPDPACGWDSQAIAAIEYAASKGARIINASWGGPGGNADLETAIETSGALVVAAAGNEGRDIDLDPVYPAAFDSPNLLTVGAIHNEGGLSDFSNWGRRSVDLVGPGEDVIVAVPGAAYAWASGTSFAAPYAAGIAALAGAGRPSVLLTPTVLRARMLGTGVPLAAAAGRTASGRLANARRAIDYRGPVQLGGISVLPTASTMGTSSVRVRLAWTAAVDDLAMGSYKVEQRRNGGPWTLVTNLTTALRQEVVIALGGTHEFRVTARDALGNMGAPVLSRVLSATRHDGTTPATRYTGTWSTATLAGATGGSTRWTTSNGASTAFTFSGRTGAVIAPTGPTRSSFKVYLDGVYQRTVSLYASTNRPPSVVYTTGTLADAAHTITLVHARVGSRVRGEVDAWVVLR